MATRSEIPSMCSPKCKYWLSGNQICLNCAKDSQKHRFNSNEISRKGYSFESFDHAREMMDDRDIVSEISPDYKREFMSQSLSSSQTAHPYKDLAKRTGVELTEVAYEQIKRFVYELCELNEKEREYLFATIEIYRKGKPSKTEEDSSYTQFALDHGLPISATTRLRESVIRKSPIAAAFIILLNGSLAGTRGRKSQFTKTFEDLHPAVSTTEIPPSSRPKRRKSVSFNCAQEVFEV